ALASTFAFGCAATISSATASRLSCLREDSTTLAPSPASANAIALPIPRDAPVTSAVLPARPVLTRCLPCQLHHCAVRYYIPTSRYTRHRECPCLCATRSLWSP